MLTKEEVEKALAGAPVETEDGITVTQLTKFRLYDEGALVGVVEGRIYVSQWTMKGSPTMGALSPLRLKKEKRTVEYTLMIQPDGETIWVESSKIREWSIVPNTWRRTNQTMTKEIEVE